MTASISLRPITPGDQQLLYRIYAGTRQEELQPLEWSEEERERFLRFQFGAQHEHYQEHFGGADFSLILVDGEPVGRLYLDRRPDELRIVDIALLPEHRRKGIGGSLLRDILVEARDGKLPVRIHVERNNPALTLYEELGFVKTGDTGVYFLMERSWKTDGMPVPTSAVVDPKRESPS